MSKTWVLPVRAFAFDAGEGRDYNRALYGWEGLPNAK
jgi:hypothetical protein